MWFYFCQLIMPYYTSYFALSNLESVLAYFWWWNKIYASMCTFKKELHLAHSFGN